MKRDIRTEHWKHVRANYRVRMMLTLAGTLLLFVVIAQWRPTPRASDAATRFYPLMSLQGQERITLERVLPTRHLPERSSIPSPVIPVVLPLDVVLDEDDLIIEDSLLVGAVPDLGRVGAFGIPGISRGAPAGFRGSAELRSGRFRCSCERH